MATVPSSGTNVRLLSGIPFSNDYKNTRYFDTLLEQSTYFAGKPVIHSMAESNFQRIEGRTFIAVDKSIDELMSVNYVMFQNAQYNPKWFYGFVTKLEYVQRHMTYVHFQIDVYQTWRFEMNFKPSFIIREHCPLWNPDGSPVINTVDEGLAYGSDYDTVQVERWRPYGDVYFMVIVTKEWMHTEGINETTGLVVPNINGVPQPLSYYIHPFKMNGGVVNVNVGGTNINASSIIDVIRAISTHDDAVNNVVSMYVTDYVGTNPIYDVGSNTMTFSGIAFNHATMKLSAQATNVNVNTVYADNIGSYTNKDTLFSNKYQGYNSVAESKLLMYPYTTLILDDLKGNRTVLKNEYIMGDDIDITVLGSLGTSNKVVYTVTNYLMGTNLDMTNILRASLEHSVINNNPSEIPIVTDMLSAYLQGNRNSLENQKASIMFNGAMSGVNNAIGGVASAGSANPVGVASAGGQIIQGAGNTVLQLQQLEAKKQDISNTPPQLAKMGSNTNFDYGNGISGLYIIKRQIKFEHRKKLGAFFNMFGYKLNEVKVPNFHTRRYWNYVQTSSCNITGNFNNEDLNEIKAVFDNGITLWHTDDVGNYALGNVVL